MDRPSLDALPHRDPFRFLSRLESLEPGICGTALWDVTGDEAFFDGHFPGNPLVPGVLLTESLAQLSGMVALSNGQSAGPTPAHLAQADMKFRHAICPPAAITLQSKLTRRMGNLCIFDVQATADDIVAADGTVVLSLHVGSTPQEGTA